MDVKMPSPTKTRAAPKATSTGSENSSRTCAGGRVTVVWGDGSVRSRMVCAEPGAAAPATRASTKRAPAAARPGGRWGRTPPVHPTWRIGAGMSKMKRASGSAPDGLPV
jgi:hypothetical protein